jgi:hypothetical protein
VPKAVKPIWRAAQRLEEDGVEVAAGETPLQLREGHNLKLHVNSSVVKLFLDDKGDALERLRLEVRN